MRILSTIHPTENQKRVLAKIAASPNSDVAGHQISGDANLVAARNMLMKLDIITYVDGEATLTDKGQQISAEENITDETGQLTDMGKKLAYTDPDEKPDNDMTAQQQGGPEMGMPGEMGMGTPGGPEMGISGGNELNIESYSILKELLNG